MRNLLVFVVAVVLGGGLVVGLAFVKRRERAAALENAPAAAPAAGETDRGPDRDSAAKPAHKPAPAKKVAEPVEAPPAPDPAALEGTLVVVDGQGNEHASESGVLALALGPGPARTRREVEVREGRWSLTPSAVRAGTRLGSLVVEGGALGRKPAVPAVTAELALPADGKLDLRLKLDAAPLLHVRARDTSAELGEVTLYELPPAQRAAMHGVQHPGPGAKKLGNAAGASPIRLETAALAADTRVFFAKSPGYAWGRIEVDAYAHGDFALDLERGGALELGVVGAPEDKGLELVIFDAAPPHAVVLDVLRGDTQSFALDDLRPGRYVAEARHSGLLAGSCELEIAAGERTKGALEVTSPPTPEVALEGVLVLPAEWQLDDFILEFLLQGRFDAASLSRGSFEIRRSEMTPEPGAPGRFHWKAKAPAARYRVLLAQAGFTGELDTGASGTNQALIEVPPPCRVSVRCVDEASGAEAWSEKLALATLGAHPNALATLATPARASTASHEYRVPQGRVAIFTAPAQFAAATRFVELGPGTNEVFVQLRKAQ